MGDIHHDIPFICEFGEIWLLPNLDNVDIF
jgi:hypothetical protein